MKQTYASYGDITSFLRAIPKPLDNHRNYSEMQSILVVMGLMKRHDIDVEWHGDIFTVRGFTDAIPGAHTKDGMLLAFSMESYNETVSMLFRNGDPKLLSSVYVMISTISPLNLLRKRLFGDDERVSKVDERSSKEELADCRVHLDLIGNLYRAAASNPLSNTEQMRQRAAIASGSIEGMESMYANAVGESDKAKGWRWRRPEEKEPEFRDVRLINAALRKERDDR